MQHQHYDTTQAREIARLPGDRAPRADAKTRRRAFDAVAYAAALEILG